MTTIYDVPADLLIEKTAKKLKKVEEINPPEWTKFVKTGVHREKAPVQKDWWYTRSAAVFRKVYIEGTIGTSRLSSMFGGKRDRGSKRNKAKRGSRAIIRHVLIQLEKSGFVKTEKGKGRSVTSKGQSFLDNTANELIDKPDIGSTK